MSSVRTKSRKIGFSESFHLLLKSKFLKNNCLLKQIKKNVREFWFSIFRILLRIHHKKSNSNIRKFTIKKSFNRPNSDIYTNTDTHLDSNTFFGLTKMSLLWVGREVVEAVLNNFFIGKIKNHEN